MMVTRVKADFWTDESDLSIQESIGPQQVVVQSGKSHRVWKKITRSNIAFSSTENYKYLKPVPGGPRYVIWQKTLGSMSKEICNSERIKQYPHLSLNSWTTGTNFLSLSKTRYMADTEHSGGWILELIRKKSSLPIPQAMRVRIHEKDKDFFPQMFRVAYNYQI